MRTHFTIVLLAVMPAVALAQSPRSASAPPTSALGPIGLPLPAIGLPLSPIGLPLQPLGLSPPPEQWSRGRPQPPAGGSAYRRPGWGPTHGATVVYLGLGLPWGSYWPGVAAVAGPATVIQPEPSARMSRGFLRLDLQPFGPHQLFIDGAYAGTMDEVSGELQLEPGRHSIEIRAVGYKRLAFDVSIQADRTITYRGTLESAVERGSESREATAVPAIPPSVIYFIPGCYLGNVPPAEVPLPAGCDRSRVITQKP